MHLNPLKIGVLAAALTIGSTAFAQGSDSCATAQVIAGQGTWATDTTAATVSPEGSNTYHAIGSDVWFEWTADVTGDATFDLCGSSYDTKLALYAGTGCPPVGAPSATEVAYDDDYCGLQSGFDNIPVVAGSTYMIEVGGFGGQTGTGSLNILITPPICSGPDDDLTTGDNDSCAAALPLPLGLNGGFQVHGAANVGGVDDDYWSVTVNPGDRLDLTADFDGTVGNINLIVFDVTAGCPGTYLTDSSLNPSDSETVSYTNNGAVAATLVVWVEANGVLFDCNDYSMNAAVTPALTNDDCSTPTVALTGVNAFDNVTATTGAEGQACTTINSDVWYSWVADFTGTALVNTCGGTGLDTKLAAYDASNACVIGAPCLDSNDDSCSLQSEVQFAATAGTTYIIQVGSYSTTTQGSGTFEIAQFIPPPPCSTDSLEPNDTCATPTPAPQGLTTGLFVAGPGDSGGENGDYYSVTVADGSSITVDIFFIDADGDIDLYLFDATDPACGTPFALSALDSDTGIVDNASVTWTNSTGASVDVVIWVDMWDSSAEQCNTYDLDVNGGSSVLGTPFCFGDGSDGVVCPCGNVATLGSGEGCEHSAGVGSFLTAAGSPTVGADTLILTINQGEPNEACIFMSNNSLNAAPFLAFDGAICLGVDANLTRHFTNPATGVPIPTILDAAGNGTNVMPLSQSDFNGLTVPGATMHYQAWMRSPSGPCASGAQFSAGISILWN